MAVNSSTVLTACDTILTQLQTIETEFSTFSALSASAQARALTVIGDVQRARQLVQNVAGVFRGGQRAQNDFTTA